MTSQLNSCDDVLTDRNQKSVSMTLYWLPICFRIDLTAWPQNIKCSGYPFTHQNAVRSSGRNLLTGPSSCFQTKGDRVFAVWALPPAWGAAASSLDFILSVLFLHSCVLFVFVVYSGKCHTLSNDINDMIHFYHYYGLFWGRKNLFSFNYSAVVCVQSSFIQHCSSDTVDLRLLFRQQ